MRLFVHKKYGLHSSSFELVHVSKSYEYCTSEKIIFYQNIMLLSCLKYKKFAYVTYCTVNG